MVNVLVIIIIYYISLVYLFSLPTYMFHSVVFYIKDLTTRKQIIVRVTAIPQFKVIIVKKKLYFSPIYLNGA